MRVFEPFGYLVISLVAGVVAYVIIRLFEVM